MLTKDGRVFATPRSSTSSDTQCFLHSAYARSAENTVGNHLVDIRRARHGTSKNDALAEQAMTKAASVESSREVTLHLEREPIDWVMCFRTQVCHLRTPRTVRRQQQSARNRRDTYCGRFSGIRKQAEHGDDEGRQRRVSQKEIEHCCTGETAAPDIEHLAIEVEEVVEYDDGCGVDDQSARVSPSAAHVTGPVSWLGGWWAHRSTLLKPKRFLGYRQESVRRIVLRSTATHTCRG